MSHDDARTSISWTHFLKYMILIAHNSSSATRSACDQLGFLSPRCQPILVSLLVALPLRRETCLACVAFPPHRLGSSGGRNCDVIARHADAGDVIAAGLDSDHRY